MRRSPLLQNGVIRITKCLSYFKLMLLTKSAVITKCRNRYSKTECVGYCKTRRYPAKYRRKFFVLEKFNSSLLNQLDEGEKIIYVWLLCTDRKRLPTAYDVSNKRLSKKNTYSPFIRGSAV